MNIIIMITTLPQNVSSPVMPLLKPTVLIYDPRIPKEEGILVNLAEEALEVTEALPRSRLSPEVQDYLNLQDSLNYFMQPDSPRT